MRPLVVIAYGIYLAALAFVDVKERKIPLKWLLLGIPFIPVSVLADGVGLIYSHVLGVLPGIGFICISLVSHGQMGMADAVLLALTGAFLGFGPSVCVIALSFLGIAIIAMLMLVLNKLGRKSTLPYIPFILFGYMVTMVIPIIGI